MSVAADCGPWRLRRSVLHCRRRIEFALRFVFYSNPRIVAALDTEDFANALNVGETSFLHLARRLLTHPVGHLLHTMGHDRLFRNFYVV